MEVLVANKIREVPMELANVYNRPLTDLGTTDSRLSGIFSPGYDTLTVNQYMTSQFTTDAQRYAARYTDFGYWSQLVKSGLRLSGLDRRRNDKLDILDIGSGAGNTIWPLVEQLPSATIIASDLSIELLAILKQDIAAMDKGDITLLQLNAEELDFKPATFDAVIGGAILHHLPHPEKALQGTNKVLKSHGVAVFIEPFELGNDILELAYTEILREKKVARKVSKQTKHFLAALIKDYFARRSYAVSPDEWKGLDDKWLFTREQVNKMATDCGFSTVTIHPLDEAPHQFEFQTLINLKVGMNSGYSALPERAWEIIRSYDKIFSEDVKKELIILGCIILRK